MENLYMKLSTLYTSVPEYIEFAWVPANPSTAGDTITEQTVTTLRLDTEVQDTGSLVRAPGLSITGQAITANNFQLPAGTYYFEAYTKLRVTAANSVGAILGLYNTSDSRYETRSNQIVKGAISEDKAGQVVCSGQFKITAAKNFDLRLLVTVEGASGTVIVDSGVGVETFSNTTAGADQRTTIKLWKVN